MNECVTPPNERTNRQTSICYRICVVTAYNIFSVCVYIDFDIIFQQRLTFAIMEWVHTNTRNTHRGVDLIFIKFLKRICYLIWIIIKRISSSSSSWYLNCWCFPILPVSVHHIDSKSISNSTKWVNILKSIDTKLSSMEYMIWNGTTCNHKEHSFHWKLFANLRSISRLENEKLKSFLLPFWMNAPLTFEASNNIHYVYQTRATPRNILWY